MLKIYDLIVNDKTVYDSQMKQVRQFIDKKNSLYFSIGKLEEVDTFYEIHIHIQFCFCQNFRLSL